MSRPFSLYLTTEVASVIPESFCAADSHPSTIFAKWLIKWLSLLASPFFSPQTLHLQICGPGDLEGRGAMSSLLHGTLLSLWFLVGEEREGEAHAPLPLQGDFMASCWRLGRPAPALVSAGQERRSLMNRVASSVCQWENLLPLSTCHGDDGLKRALQVFSWTLGSPPDVLKYLLQ